MPHRYWYSALFFANTINPAAASFWKEGGVEVGTPRAFARGSFFEVEREIPNLISCKDPAKKLP